jgi:hypothetical protein
MGGQGGPPIPQWLSCSRRRTCGGLLGPACSSGTAPTKRRHSHDVVGKLPQTLADQEVAAVPQQIHHNRPQECEHWGADLVGVAMGVLTQLGVAGLVYIVFNAPKLPDPAQQRFWSSAHAGEEQMSPRAALALGGERVGVHLPDPGTGRPVCLDVLRCLSGP